MFEVWEINANGINSQTHKLQTALARDLDKLERNQKKGKSSTYKGWLAIAKLKPLSLFISLLSIPKKAFDNVKIEK